jgi:hypothetical protein
MISGIQVVVKVKPVGEGTDTRRKDTVGQAQLVPGMVGAVREMVCGANCRLLSEAEQLCRFDASVAGNDLLHQGREASSLASIHRVRHTASWWLLARMLVSKRPISIRAAPSHPSSARAITAMFCNSRSGTASLLSRKLTPTACAHHVCFVPNQEIAFSM